MCVVHLMPFMMSGLGIRLHFPDFRSGTVVTSQDERAKMERVGQARAGRDERAGMDGQGPPGPAVGRA